MTGQMLVSGMGELHLEILMDRMEREFGVKANLGRPQVAYKEAITSPARGEGRYVRHIGAKSQYGHCVIQIEPLEKGERFEFHDRTKDGTIPSEFIPSIKDGIQEAMEVGVLAGFPVASIRVELLDGSYHEIDSTPIAFKIAGSFAFKDAAAKANPVLLEPVMSLEVVTPEEYMGDIVGDINSRRGRIEEMDARAGSRVVKALVPLAEMFGYASVIRTLTQGRGVFSMEFFEYQPTSRPIMEEIIARVEGRLPMQR
jgi:elongation factor G